MRMQYGDTLGRSPHCLYLTALRGQRAVHRTRGFFLDTPVGLSERGRLAGMIRGADVQHFLTVAAAAAGRSTVLLQAAPLGGTFLL